MYKNYLKQFARFLRKDPFHSTLNIIGLAVGMASCIIILLYLQNELSYDKHHVNHKNIYRYGVQMTIGGPPTNQLAENAVMGILLKEEYPEIKYVARFRPVGKTQVNYKNNKFFEENLSWADSTTFDVFTHRFIAGDPKSALNGINQIVLTEKLAKKYFGDSNPVGGILDLQGIGLLKVTAVIEDTPANSFEQYDGLISFATLFRDISYEKQYDPSQLCSDMNTFIYFLVNKNFTEDIFYSKFENIFNKHIKGFGFGYKPIIEPISETYLNSKLLTSYSTSNRIFLYGFTAVGILILILASINYINLATSRAMLRAKEIGVRKVVGAKFGQLVVQFLGESLLLSVISMIIALGIVEALLNFSSFESLIGLKLTLNLFGNQFLLLGIIAIILFTGGISGLYPSFYLSRITPISSLKSSNQLQKGKLTLRKLLVAVQFVISIMVVATMLLMKNQIEFAKTKDLGFNGNNLMIIQASDPETAGKLLAYKDEIKKIPGVESSTLSNVMPGVQTIGFAFNWEGANGEMEVHAYQSIMADKDFVQTLGLEFVEGENFKGNTVEDQNTQFIVNQSLVKELGWEKSVGKLNKHGAVVGVVKDFNSSSIKRPIGPLFIAFTNQGWRYLTIRLAATNVPESIKGVVSKWEEVFPDILCEYTFLDERLQKLYEKETNQNYILELFSFVCIIISCLGLLSLTSFSTERRTREIGIRKVFGAQTVGIVKLVTREISLILLVSMVIAIPISVYTYNIWLENFAYKAELSIMIFVVTFIGAAFVVLFTSSYHVIKAARRNPIESLRYE